VNYRKADITTRPPKAMLRTSRSGEQPKHIVFPNKILRRSLPTVSLNADIWVSRRSRQIFALGRTYGDVPPCAPNDEFYLMERLRNKANRKEEISYA